MVGTAPTAEITTGVSAPNVVRAPKTRAVEAAGTRRAERPTARRAESAVRAIRHATPLARSSETIMRENFAALYQRVNGRPASRDELDTFIRSNNTPEGRQQARQAWKMAARAERGQTRIDTRLGTAVSQLRQIDASQGEAYNLAQNLAGSIDSAISVLSGNPTPQERLAALTELERAYNEASANSQVRRVLDRSNVGRVLLVTSVERIALQNKTDAEIATSALNMTGTQIRDRFREVADAAPKGLRERIIKFLDNHPAVSEALIRAGRVTHKAIATALLVGGVTITAAALIGGAPITGPLLSIYLASSAAFSAVNIVNSIRSRAAILQQSEQSWSNGEALYNRDRRRSILGRERRMWVFNSRHVVSLNALVNGQNTDGTREIFGGRIRGKTNFDIVDRAAGGNGERMSVDQIREIINEGPSNPNFERAKLQLTSRIAELEMRREAQQNNPNRVFIADDRPADQRATKSLSEEVNDTLASLHELADSASITPNEIAAVRQVWDTAMFGVRGDLSLDYRSNIRGGAMYPAFVIAMQGGLGSWLYASAAAGHLVNPVDIARHVIAQKVNAAASLVPGPEHVAPSVTITDHGHTYHFEGPNDPGGTPAVPTEHPGTLHVPGVGDVKAVDWQWTDATGAHHLTTFIAPPDATHPSGILEYMGADGNAHAFVATDIQMTPADVPGHVPGTDVNVSVPVHDLNNATLADVGACCFIAGTKVLMGDGSEKNIEEIKIGELIMSYDENAKKIIAKQVLQTISPVNEDLVKINFSNGTENINNTDHPYFIKGKGWASFNPEKTFVGHKMNVIMLEVNDTAFVFAQGQLQEVVITSLSPIKQSTQTYNLAEVADTHTFFANRILVHNKAMHFEAGGDTKFNETMNGHKYTFDVPNQAGSPDPITAANVLHNQPIPGSPNGDILQLQFQDGKTLDLVVHGNQLEYINHTSNTLSPFSPNAVNLSGDTFTISQADFQQALSSLDTQTGPSFINIGGVPADIQNFLGWVAGNPTFWGALVLGGGKELGTPGPRKFLRVLTATAVGTIGGGLVGGVVGGALPSGWLIQGISQFAFGGVTGRWFPGPQVYGFVNRIIPSRAAVSGFVRRHKITTAVAGLVVAGGAAAVTGVAGQVGGAIAATGAGGAAGTVGTAVTGIGGAILSTWPVSLPVLGAAGVGYLVYRIVRARRAAASGGAAATGGGGHRMPWQGRTAAPPIGTPSGQPTGKPPSRGQIQGQMRSEGPIAGGRGHGWAWTAEAFGLPAGLNARQAEEQLSGRLEHYHVTPTQVHTAVEHGTARVQNDDQVRTILRLSPTAPVDDELRIQARARATGEELRATATANMLRITGYDTGRPNDPLNAALGYPPGIGLDDVARRLAVDDGVSLGVLERQTGYTGRQFTTPPFTPQQLAGRLESPRREGLVARNRQTHNTDVYEATVRGLGANPADTDSAIATALSNISPSDLSEAFNSIAELGRTGRDTSGNLPANEVENKLKEIRMTGLVRSLTPPGHTTAQLSEKLGYETTVTDPRELARKLLADGLKIDDIPDLIAAASVVNGKTTLANPEAVAKSINRIRLSRILELPDGTATHPLTSPQQDMVTDMNRRGVQVGTGGARHVINDWNDVMEYYAQSIPPTEMATKPTPPPNLRSEWNSAPGGLPGRLRVLDRFIPFTSAQEAYDAAGVTRNSQRENELLNEAFRRGLVTTNPGGWNAGAGTPQNQADHDAARTQLFAQVDRKYPLANGPDDNVHRQTDRRGLGDLSGRLRGKIPADQAEELEGVIFPGQHAVKNLSVAILGTIGLDPAKLRTPQEYHNLYAALPPDVQRELDGAANNPTEIQAILARNMRYLGTFTP